MKNETNIQKLAESFILKKSNRSFEELFVRLKPGICNRCFLILKDFELAQDAFINAMEKIWNNVDQYEPNKSKFSTWSYKIAEREALRILKSNKKTKSYVNDELEAVLLKNSPENLGLYYTLEEDQSFMLFIEEDKIDSVYESVLDEIRALPETYRNIMIDREIHGMKYKDIAEKYGIKKRSIATRIRRARGRIKKKMETSLNPNKMKKTTKGR